MDKFCSPLFSLEMVQHTRSTEIKSKPNYSFKTAYHYLKARPSCSACSFPMVVNSPPHLTINNKEWSLSTGTASLSSLPFWSTSSVSFGSSLPWVLVSLLSFLFTSFSSLASACLFFDSFPCFFFPLLSSDPESRLSLLWQLSLLSLSFPSLGLPRYLNWIFRLIPEK